MGFRVLVATRNRGKLAELRRMWAEVPGLQLVGIEAVRGAPEVEEDGERFEDNAEKKARELAAFAGIPTLADDSGLEVDALDGAPGVRSARFAGPGADDDANNRLLLARLEGVPEAERGARFRCVLAFVDLQGALGGEVHFEHGVCEGRIGFEPRGSHGFGYDPLFVPQGDSGTLAELGPEVKDRISHRGQAAQRMGRFLAEYLIR